MGFRTLDTRAIHAGAPEPRVGGAVVTPIFQSANYLQRPVATYGEVTYVRLHNTPNHQVLAHRLAALESAEDAVVTASGMAAVAAAVLSVLSAGDHALVQRELYGGTRTFFDREAARLGIAVSSVDPTRPDGWAAALRPSTRLFYVESVSNPLLSVPDLPAVVAFAREHGLVSAIDNTFLSPVNFRPAEHGFDLVLHSATKYLNGHSDVAAGVVAGSAARIAAVRERLAHFGPVLDPHACFLLERGLKTLGLRVRRQNRTALRLAHALRDHPAVARVVHPGLPGDPSAARAALFDGFGGMVSFDHRDAGAVDRFFAALRIPLHAASLGGVETLVVRPARSSHLGVDPAQREAMGIRDSLVRISVGIEDPDELVEDVLRALDRSIAPA